MLEINEKIRILPDDIRIRYVRSRGPGGQNVNKVNTQAQLVFDVKGCSALSAAARKRLICLAGRRMSSEGKLIICSDRHRSQSRNRQECLDRLRELVQKALIRPRKRLATKPTKSAREKRLENKTRRSRTKQLRRGVSENE